MQTPLQDLRHAIRACGKYRVALVTTCAVLFCMGVDIATPGSVSSVAGESQSASPGLILKPAVYCSIPRKSSHSQSLRVFLSDLLGLDEGSGQISIPKVCSMGALSTILFDNLGITPARRRSAQLAADRMRIRIDLLRHSDLQPHAWTSGNDSGRDILITWMNREMVRIKTQKTKISRSATQFSVFLAIRTGDARRPWATVGLQALQGSTDAADSQDTVNNLLATEVTVTSVLPSVAGAPDQAFTASWSSKRLANMNPFCARKPIARSSCSQAAA